MTEKKLGLGTRALHAGQKPDSEDAVAGGADLPDVIVCIPFAGTCSQFVRTQGVRQYLHAPHESYDGRARAASRGIA